MGKAMVEVKNLSKNFAKNQCFRKKEDSFEAVKNVSFSIAKGEIVGLLGESGCGKSTLARMILGLTKISSGEIRYNDIELHKLSEKGYRAYRREIQMIFQNPFDCLDPGMVIKKQLLEALGTWKIGNSRGERMEKILSLCRECGLDEDCLDKLSGEFSGGQLQRIAIVRALLLNPSFLVADEIVSALDVSIQNQILDLLLQMKRKHDLTVLFISHDIAAIRKVLDRIMVMKEGEILENGTYEELLKRDKTAYIHTLLNAAYYFI